MWIHVYLMLLCGSTFGKVLELQESGRLWKLLNRRESLCSYNCIFMLRFSVSKEEKSFIFSFGSPVICLFLFVSLLVFCVLMIRSNIFNFVSFHMQPGGPAHFKANQVAALTFPFTSCSRQPWPLGHGGFEHCVLQKWYLSSKSLCLQVQFCFLRNPGRLSVSFSGASASWALCSSGSRCALLPCF